METNTSDKKELNSFTQSYIAQTENFSLKIVEFYFLVQLALTSAGVTLYIYNKITLIIIPLCVSILFGSFIFFCLFEIKLRLKSMWQDLQKADLSSLPTWILLENKSIGYLAYLVLFTSFGLIGIGIISLNIYSEKLFDTNWLTKILLQLAVYTLLYYGVYKLFTYLVRRILAGHIADNIKFLAKRSLDAWTETLEICEKGIKVKKESLSLLKIYRSNPKKYKKASANVRKIEQKLKEVKNFNKLIPLARKTISELQIFLTSKDLSIEKLKSILEPAEQKRSKIRLKTDD